MNPNETKYQKILSDAKLKRTTPRLAVVALLADKHVPLSAQQIHKLLGKKKGIDLVTIYRTLTSFEKAGVVKRVDLRKDVIFYELNVDDHHHVICLDCKKVSDFIGCDADILIAKALKQVKNFKLVSHHSFDLFGICNTCSKK
jgi:Fe2+ or Zn2+ uptake regulation protein